MACFLDTTKDLNPGDIYAEAVRIIPASDIDHHNSDLYLRITPETKVLVNRLNNKILLSWFMDTEGHWWYELPFCFTPYWANPRKYT